MDEQEEPQVHPQHDSLPLRNIIDLTNEVEFVEARGWVPEPQGGPQDLQFIGSNSSVSMENVVDLTNDQEQNESDEVIFTGQRTLFFRQNMFQPNPRTGPRQVPRVVSRPGPRPTAGGSTQDGLPSNNSSLLVPSRPVLPVVPPGYRLRTVRSNHGRFSVDFTSFGQMFSSHSMERIPALWQLGALHNMANHLDYGNRSFEQRSHANHMPPPAARDNFTRSPTASDVLVCPSCDEELTHNKEDFLGKKASKVSSKKDREEHPFWVVKECGHVCHANKFITIIFLIEN